MKESFLVTIFNACAGLCYNCAGFGHLAANCQNQKACLKCGEEHNQKECQKKDEEGKCNNCQGRHHSTFKGCPVRLKAFREERRKSLSYASAVTGNKNKTNAQANEGRNQAATENWPSVNESRYGGNHNNNNDNNNNNLI